jgi:hypothetical protein
MDLGKLIGGMSMGSMVAGLIFSGIGFVAFMYGKKEGRFQPMAIGGALMVYPYFVSNTALVCAIGAVLTAALFFMKD